MFVTLLMSGLVLGGVYGIVALGFALIYKSSNLMTFMQGDLLMLGGYIGYTFYKTLGVPFILAFVCTAVIMMALGFLLERFVIRKMVSRGVNPFYIVLATIACSFIIQNAVQQIWGTSNVAFPPIFKNSSVELFGRNFKPEAFLCVAVSILIMILLQVFLKYTKFGVAMRAAALDNMAAKACGINVSLSVGVSWGIASCTAALAGVLIAPIYSLYSTLGTIISTKGFAAAVIGGFGNMYGAIVGGFILGLIETFVSGYVSSTYSDLISYAILLIFLFVKPFGLFNERTLED